MKLPADLLERPAGESARLVVLSLLAQAHHAAKRLHHPEDAEALHDFRVAIRRTRAALESWSDRLPKKAKRLRRELTEIQRATGPARDTEVALDWLDAARTEAGAEASRAIDWISAVMISERDAATDVREMERAFEDVRARLLARVRVMEYDLLAERPEETYAELLSIRVCERFEDLAQLLWEVGGPEDVERMHRARIAGKGLRYLVEPILHSEPLSLEVVNRMKELQDLLGELHDVHVLADRIAGVRAAVDDFAMRTAIDQLQSSAASRAVVLHRRLVDDWIAPGLQELRAAVHELSRALAEHKSVEIERKYLLSGMPELPEGAESIEIEQGYLPGDRLRERVRRVKRDGSIECYRTIKLGLGVQRMELEEQCTPEVFEALWALTEGCRVRKRRYLVDEGALTWEIDQFLDRDLVLAEVELQTAEAKPIIPEWLAKRMVEDVTDRREFTNLSLAR